MTDRRTDVPPTSGDEIARRARAEGPPEQTPVQGASRASGPPRPPRGREDERTDPPLPPGAR